MSRRDAPRHSMARHTNEILSHDTFDKLAPSSAKSHGRFDRRASSIASNGSTSRKKRSVLAARGPWAMTMIGKTNCKLILERKIQRSSVDRVSDELNRQSGILADLRKRLDEKDQKLAAISAEIQRNRKESFALRNELAARTAKATACLLCE